MVDADFDGSKNQDFEKVIIPEGAYPAILVDFSDVTEQTGTVTDKEGNVKEVTREMMRWGFSIKEKENEPAKDFTMFVRAKVYKSNQPKYSNSKLYEILDKANLIEAFKEEWKKIEVMDKEQRNKAFVQWLKDNLSQKGCQVSVKTVNKGFPEKEYSAVKEILRFGA